MYGQGLAACAGLCAAMASVCAKLAMASRSSLGLCVGARRVMVEHIGRDQGWSIVEKFDAYLPPCDDIVTYVRLSFFGLIFLFNALMWTLFTKSLQTCSTTVEATVINTAANLLSTAVMGHLVFGEALSLVWLAGASLIIIGLVFIHSASSDDDPHSHTPEKKKS